MTRPERLGDRHRDLGFGFDKFRAHLLYACFHFLLRRDGSSTALFGAGTCDLKLRGRLIALQLGADVIADEYIGNIDRKNLECRTGIESLIEYYFRDAVRTFEHFLVRFR